MRGDIYDNKIKKEAKHLRATGKTYSEIKLLLNIPKSTLSNWLSKKYSGVFNKKAQLIHLSKIRPIAAAAKKKRSEIKKEILREKIAKEIKSYPLNHQGFLKSILAILYLAEGAKYEGVSGLKFVNTDPNLSQFYINLLRTCFVIDESRFRIRLHLHYYHKLKKSKEFWSKLLNVPLNQFQSVYIKKRSRKKRFRKNFMGICFINYLDSTIRKELLELANQLQESL